MISRRTLCKLVGLGTALELFGLPAAVGATESIGLVVPFPAGGGADVLARTLAQSLGEELGAKIWIDNHPGAGGTLGAQYFSKHRADGSSLGYVTNGILCVNPLLYPHASFEPSESLTPVGRISEIGLIAVMNPSAFGTLEAFIEAARKSLGQFTFASSGIGTTSHLAGLLFAQKAGIDLLHVPYRGGNAAILDVLAGRISMMVDVAPNVLPHIRSGKLLALGACSPERLSAADEVPTLKEVGLEGVEISAWDGIVLPKDAPAELVEKFSLALSRALERPDTQAAFAKKGAEPRPGTPEDFQRWIATEKPKWAGLVEKIKAQED